MNDSEVTVAEYLSVRLKETGAPHRKSSNDFLSEKLNMQRTYELLLEQV